MDWLGSVVQVPQRPCASVATILHFSRPLTLDVDSNRSSTRAMSPQDDDPRPTPPVPPTREDCCQCSCNPCIFDLYDDALDRYRTDLQAWEERQARRKKDVP